MTNVLITGANRGIGFEIARQLGKKGLHVYLTARNQKAGEDAAAKLQQENINVDFVQLDIADLRSVENAAMYVRSQTESLGILINNAAMLSSHDKDLLTVHPAVINETIHTNVFGALQVVQHFAPMLQQGSRIINVSSGGGSMTDPVGGWAPVYCISKAALNALTRHLAYYLHEKNISVNAMCPGWVRTDMGGSGATRSVEKGAETAVWLATEAPASYTGKFFRDKKEIPW
jgi:NAD(P)-dependent dehydrogenase (short-subunit alcohol dehydrogenase family)